MASGGVKSFYRQKKKGGISKKKNLPSISSKKKASQSGNKPLDADVKDEQEMNQDVLRQFDLNTKYGPCVGMSRLERWERANKLGMNPPSDIEALLRNGIVGADCVFGRRI